jgi:hypothetical protein
MKININQKGITLQKEEGFGRPRKNKRRKKIKMAAKKSAKKSSSRRAKGKK